MVKTKAEKDFPIAICVMSDSTATCNPDNCSVDVHKCFPNYKIPVK